jgi:hypothetical protein
MTSASRRLLLTFLVGLATLGCDSGGDPSPDTPDSSTTGEEGKEGVDDVGPDPAPDARSDDADVEDAEPPFVLGVNITGQSIPGSFTELPEGDELLVEFGPQGLWMVVLAFKTKDLFEGLLLIKAAVESEGVLQGEFTMTGQQLLPGPGGYAYFYNFFLVVSDPNVAGYPGLVTLAVTDATGYTHEEVRNVQFVGGLETLQD